MSRVISQHLTREEFLKLPDNILYCLDPGYQLDWLLDLEDHSILVFRPNQQPVFLQDDEQLPNSYLLLKAEVKKDY